MHETIMKRNVLPLVGNDAVVKYTLGDESQTQIYASKYLSYMPTEEELRRELNFQALLEQSKE